VGYLRAVQGAMDAHGVGVIGSVIGRYYAMDRDLRWERTERSYRALVGSSEEATEADDPIAALQASYASGTTDEFVTPIVVAGAPRVSDGDAVLFFNFRADRARQITRAFIEDGFEGFDREPPRVHYTTFTSYQADFDVPVAFPKEDLAETLGEVVSRAGLTQLRAAETEKYPHVTFFFNGGREVQFEGEKRILVPSPKVATYDLKPEMSAPELASRVAVHIREQAPSLVVLNFANPDMVGHTGDFDAAVRAVEAVDGTSREVIEAALDGGYSVEIIADHGNADKMRTADGSPHTAHTTSLVPHLVIAPGVDAVRPGVLGDIAPTILRLLGLEQPAAMTGTPLVG
ncbi:MAG: 2,3-bisphosphoglycerate-independent phosphoglycerate mutase, partial [Bacteroidota bacterium]